MWQHIPVRGNVSTDAREHSYKPVQMMYSAMVHSPTERFRNMTSLCTCPKSCFTVLHKPWYPSSLASVYEIISLYPISPIYKERESLDRPNSVVYSCYRVPGEWKSFLRNTRSVFITTVEKSRVDI